MSTYGQLPGVKPQAPVGVFEPSLELLERFRGLLASSPPTSRRSSAVTLTNAPIAYTFLPFQPEQRRQSQAHDSKPHRKSISEVLRSEPREIRITKSSNNHRKRQSKSSSPPPNLPDLIHPNIVDPLDILQDESGGYTITFTSMIPLSTLLIEQRKLPVSEADSYFKRLVQGIDYLHRSGIAHRDIRPENMVVTVTGVLKISNLESADYLVDKGRNKSKKKTQRWNSSEYLAPEAFLETDLDPKACDMWATGVVYLEMRTGRTYWGLAAERADEGYDRYLMERSGVWGFRPIENLSDEHCRRVVTALPDPIPTYRYTASRVLKSTWCRGIELSKPVKNEEK